MLTAQSLLKEGHTTIIGRLTARRGKAAGCHGQGLICKYGTFNCGVQARMRVICRYITREALPIH